MSVAEGKDQSVDDKDKEGSTEGAALHQPRVKGKGVGKSVVEEDVVLTVGDEDFNGAAEGEGNVVLSEYLEQE